MKSLEKFLWVEGEFLFSLLSGSRSLKCRNEERELLMDQNYEALSDSRSGSTGAISPVQNYYSKIPLTPLLQGVVKVIPVELSRIRSASFGPIRKQIKPTWTQAHTAGPWDSVSWANKCPACLSTAHPWVRGPWNPEQWLIHWTDARLSKVLLHLACFNTMPAKRGPQTLSSVLRLLWHLRLLRAGNAPFVAVRPLA